MERRMAHLRKTHDRGKRLGAPAPTSLGLLAILTVLVWWPIPVLASLLPAAHVLPMFSLVSLAVAGAVTLLAWHTGADRDSDGIGFWDVAGILAFFGFAAGMLSEPTHAVQWFALATATR
jgi:hypothetical protein